MSPSPLSYRDDTSLSYLPTATSDYRLQRNGRRPRRQRFPRFPGWNHAQSSAFTLPPVDEESTTETPESSPPSSIFRWSPKTQSTSLTATSQSLSEDKTEDTLNALELLALDAGLLSRPDSPIEDNGNNRTANEMMCHRVGTHLNKNTPFYDNSSLHHPAPSHNDSPIAASLKYDAFSPDTTRNAMTCLFGSTYLRKERNGKILYLAINHTILTIVRA